MSCKIIRWRKQLPEQHRTERGPSSQSRMTFTLPGSCLQRPGQNFIEVVSLWRRESARGTEMRRLHVRIEQCHREVPSRDHESLSGSESLPHQFRQNSSERRSAGLVFESATFTAPGTCADSHAFRGSLRLQPREPHPP